MPFVRSLLRHGGAGRDAWCRQSRVNVDFAKLRFYFCRQRAGDVFLVCKCPESLYSEYVSHNPPQEEESDVSVANRSALDESADFLLEPVGQQPSFCHCRKEKRDGDDEKVIVAQCFAELPMERSVDGTLNAAGRAAKPREQAEGTFGCKDKVGWVTYVVCDSAGNYHYRRHDGNQPAPHTPISGLRGLVMVFRNAFYRRLL